jgi:hypothetical protein
LRKNSFSPAFIILSNLLLLLRRLVRKIFIRRCWANRQIIAIAGKRVYNAEKLAEVIGQSSQTIAKIVVLRQGKMVSLSLPSEIASQLVAKVK